MSGNRGGGALLSAMALLALVAYGGLLLRHRVTAVGGADTSGYANTARLILSGRIVAPIEVLDRLGLPDRFARAVTPLAFELGLRPRTAVPYYPPGFPLHVALATAVTGWETGPFIVSPLAALACLALTFLLGRELGLSRPLALVGAAILAGCPVFLTEAVQPMSDVVAAVWAVAAVLFALRSRRRDGWALAAGAALGVAVLVRPTSGLVALPFALALAWRPRALALALAGSLPFAIFFVAWNHAAYGGYLHTGYAGQLGSELALANFPARLRHYGHWTMAQLSPLIPMGALAVAADRRVPARDRAMLLLCVVPLFVFYCCWKSYELWWFTRYLIPALPAAIVATLLVVRDLARVMSERGVPAWIVGAAVPAVLLIIAAAELRTIRQVRPLDVARQQSVSARATRALAAKAAGGRALVLSMEFSGALRFYTDLDPIRWDYLSPADFATLRARAVEQGYRLFALLLPDEVEAARARIPGRWLPTARTRGAAIWELAPDAAGAACPTGAVPQPEICNGADDDCNGAVDDIPRTVYSDRDTLPVALFQTKNAGCIPTDDARWLACNDAIHRRCRDVACRTTGIGPFEYGPAGTTTSACLTSDPPLDVDAADLARSGGGCPRPRPRPRPEGPTLSIADRFACTRSIHALCTRLGYASGFGPVGSPGPGRWSVVCLHSGHAVVVPTTYPALRAYHEGCISRDTLEASSISCMTAANRACRDDGYTAGYGPVADPDGRSPAIVCLDR